MSVLLQEHEAAVSALTVQLYDWQSPNEFGAILDRITPLINRSPRSDVTPHRHREFKPYREAWVLKRALERLGATDVRLLPEATDSPDAEVRVADEVVSVEITEVVERQSRPSVPLPIPRSDGALLFGTPAMLATVYKSTATHARGTSQHQGA